MDRCPKCGSPLAAGYRFSCGTIVYPHAGCDESEICLRRQLAAANERADELAKRMRAARRWLADELLDLSTAELDVIFDGPVPECRACAEKRAIALEIIDIFTQERTRRHNIADKIDALHRIEDRARRILARYAADEGGGHE